MAVSTYALDNRIRSLVVVLPILALLIWIESEIATEEFIIPAAILLVFGVMILFSVFMKTVRFESAVLCLLIGGYLVGNRGFAELTLARPAFPGEVCMVLIILAMLVRYALARELPDFSGSLARFILIYCGIGAVSLLFSYKIYGLDAIRDSAMVYYSIYFFFGRQVASQPASEAMLEKCLRYSFLALVPITVIQRVAPDLFITSQGGLSLLFQKDDLVTVFCAVAVFILYTRPNIFRFRWVRPTLILYYIAYVANGIGRASLAALVIGAIPLLVAGRQKFLIYPTVALVLGLTVLGGLSVGFGDSHQTTDPSIFLEKLTSMVDVTGSHTYDSDFGELKAATNEFRRELWQSFFEETNEASPIFGRGFGYDFLAHFEDAYRLGEWQGLRSAHNFYVTLYGRLGIVGSLVFLAITWQVIAGGIRAALGVRSGWLPLSILGYWCSTWAILIASAFGVVLEGPVGAIVFWTFLGVGTGAVQTARANHLATIQEPLLTLNLPEVPRTRQFGQRTGTSQPTFGGG